MTVNALMCWMTFSVRRRLQSAGLFSAESSGVMRGGTKIKTSFFLVVIVCVLNMLLHLCIIDVVCLRFEW